VPTNKPIAAIVPIETHEKVLQQREKTFSVLYRIWREVPPVSKEKAQANIEQVMINGRAKKTHKSNKLSP